MDWASPEQPRGRSSLYWERVYVALKPEEEDVHVTVRSAAKLRVAQLDLGRRNQKNVASVLNAMTTRLGSWLLERGC